MAEGSLGSEYTAPSSRLFPRSQFLDQEQLDRVLADGL